MNWTLALPEIVRHTQAVMAGLDPAIHDFLSVREGVDARVNPRIKSGGGHDGEGLSDARGVPAERAAR